MSDKDIAVVEICSLLGYETSLVEDSYLLNNCDSELTIDYLLHLTSDELEEIRASIKKKKKSNIVETPDVARSDLYDTIVAIFEQQLEEQDIKKMFLSVAAELGDLNAVSDEVLMEKVMDQIQFHLAVRDMSEVEKDLEPAAMESVTTSQNRTYDTFAAMFKGLIRKQIIKKLWKESKELCETTPVRDDDVVDIAVLQALDHLDDAEERTRLYHLKQDMLAAQKLAQEEGFELAGDFSADNAEEMEPLTSEESMYQFVSSQLSEDINENDIRAALARFPDPMDAIYYLEEKTAGTIDERDEQAQLRSYKNIASGSSSSGSGSDLIKKRVKNSSSSSSSSSSGSSYAVPVLSANYVPPTAPIVVAKDPYYRSLLNANKSTNIMFGDHFLKILMNMNPGIKARLNPESKFIEYLGFDPHVVIAKKGLSGHATKSSAAIVPEIDLHKLFVPYALQVVDSAINFYLNMKSGGRSDDSTLGLKGTSVGGAYKVVVQIIVGKGLHSVNKIAKIRPAVEKYLINEREGQVKYIPVAEGGALLISVKR